LLNATTSFKPTADNLKLSFTGASDTSSIENHPQIRFLEQQKQISRVNTQLQKSRLFPDLNIGYNNMTIQGTGADNVTYTKSTRFNSIQFGVGVPLFFWSQRAKISSSKTLQMISENNYEAGLLSFKAEYEAAYKKYETQLQTVRYFEETAVHNAATITKTADEQFKIGEINYLEWTMLINNATVILSNYTEAVQELNLSVIKLNYLTAK